MKKDSKREVAIFTQLKDRINEYLVQNEFIESEYFMVTDIYAAGIFITNFRAIILKPANAIGGIGKPKVKKVSIESINYTNIETVSYNEGILGYDTVVIKIKGSFVGHTLTIKKDKSKKLYSDLNQKLMFNTMPLERKEETPKENTFSKKELKEIQKREEKEINKEKRKEVSKKVANYLGDKTIQFSKWGIKQVKRKSEQIIHDIKEKKENNDID